MQCMAKKGRHPCAFSSGPDRLSFYSEIQIIFRTVCVDFLLLLCGVHYTVYTVHNIQYEYFTGAFSYSVECLIMPPPPSINQVAIIEVWREREGVCGGGGTHNQNIHATYCTWY